MLNMLVSGYRRSLGSLALALVKAGTFVRRCELRSVSPTDIENEEKRLELLAHAYGPVERHLTHHVYQTASHPLWSALAQDKLVKPFMEMDERVNDIQARGEVRTALSDVAYVSKLLAIESRILDRRLRGLALDGRLTRKRVGALAVYLSERYWGFQDHFEFIEKLYKANIVSDEEIEAIRAHFEEKYAKMSEVPKEASNVAQEG